MNRLNALILTCVALIPYIFFGCKNNGGTFDKGKGNLRNKTLSDPQQQPTTTQSDLLAQVKPAVNSSYELTVRSRSGTVLCAGNTNLVINSNLSLSVPSANMKCLTATVDLARLLTGVATSDGGSLSRRTTNAESDLSADGKVLRKATIGVSKFTPARPLILGPIIQDPTKFRGFTESNTYQVVSEGVSASGQIAIQVIEVNSSFKPEHFAGDTKFDEILHWQMTSIGFSGIKRAKAFLFDKIEFYWNVRPLAIPRIIIEADLDDLTGGGIVIGNFASLGNGLLGKLTIDIQATSHQAL